MLIIYPSKIRIIIRVTKIVFMLMLLMLSHAVFTVYIYNIIHLEVCFPGTKELGSGSEIESKQNLNAQYS